MYGVRYFKGGIKFLEKFRPIMWVENHYELPNKLNKYLPDQLQFVLDVYCLL